jgi:hypothetical protein
MKQFVTIKEKRVAAIVLFVALLAIGLNQVLYEKDYRELDKNISSLYQDRLMTSGYLFKISDHLYQKKILHMDEIIASPQLNAKLVKHDEAISKLIYEYEKTYLTKDEKQQWTQLLASLEAYKTVEENYLNNNTAESQSRLNEHFIEAQANLRQLSSLQAKEGGVLQNNSKVIIGETVVQSYLQIAMLFVLAVVGTILLLARDNPFFPSEKKAILN